jgi:hypothetical protein
LQHTGLSIGKALIREYCTYSSYACSSIKSSKRSIGSSSFFSAEIREMASVSHVVPFGTGFSGCNEWYQEEGSKSFWMVTGLGELLSDESGVAGDGEREAVAVADDEDMLLGVVMGEEDDKRVNYVGRAAFL